MNQALYNEVIIIPSHLGRAERGVDIALEQLSAAPPSLRVLPPHSPAVQVELLVHVFVHDSSPHVLGGGRILTHHFGVELALGLTAAADDDGAGGRQLEHGGYPQGDVIIRERLPGGGGRVCRCGLCPDQFPVGFMLIP